MGKSLIIKGADFSENGIAPIRPYLPYDIQNEILDDEEVNRPSIADYGRYSISSDLYDEYLAGKTIVGIKIKICTAGTLSFFKQDSANHTAELFETLNFESTGWQTKMFSTSIEFKNGIYLSIMKRLDDASPLDTGTFCFTNGEGASAVVSDAKFSKGSGGITTGSLENISNRVWAFCFICLNT